MADPPITAPSMSAGQDDPRRQMRAVVATAPWSFDDTQANLQPRMRNHIPASLKQNGLFNILTGNQGLWIRDNGTWAEAVFFREGKQILGE